MQKDDVIYRQAAIDALGRIGSLDTYADREYATEIFMNLPPAQPEIIHCGNCKHHSDEEPGTVYCPEIIGGWVKNDCFCAIWEAKQ